MNRALAPLAALAVLGLAACAPAERPPGAAELRQRIERHLAQPDPTAYTALAPADLERDEPLRAALLAAGVVERHGDAYAFSAAGRRASVDCGSAREPELRCFALARLELVEIADTVRTPVTVAGGGQDETFFRYRARPRTPLAQRLARAGVLVCDTGPGRTAPWRGAATIAYGVIVTNARPALADLVEARGPRLRLRPPGGLHDLLRDGA